MSDDESRDDEPVLISALEHYAYCQRQSALIHLEHSFEENIFTLRGRMAHERVDTAATRSERNVRVERGLPLWSRRLGLTGRADVVEYRDGVPLPVEYKLGKRREWRYEAIQVCAQGMCLEEMLGVPVPVGAIYYVGSRVRREVPFDEALRRMVEEAAMGMRVLLAGTQLPPGPNDRRCDKCSLTDACLPGVVATPRRLRHYRDHLFRVDLDDAATASAPSAPSAALETAGE
jgi:CRISPR-associated exonuclease Cas4